MKSERRKLRRAFTLIELLVVTGIITVLISVLLPSLSKARDAARMVRCQGILKQMGAANHMYANDANDWFVPHRVGPAWRWYQNIRWRALMGMIPGAPYAYPPSLVCPKVPPEVAALPDRNYGSNGITSPSNPRVPSVEMDMPYHDGDYDPDGVDTGTGALVRIFRGRIRNAGGKCQTMDASDWQVVRAGLDWRTRWDLNAEALGQDQGPGGGFFASAAAYRHNEGANLLMFDGHVEWRHKTAVFFYNANGTVDQTRVDDLWYVYR